MSYLSEQEIACPYCKHPTTAELWAVINVREDPELKDLLLGGEINVVECASCKENFYAEHFLLYHDPSNEIMAFVFPSDETADREALAEKARADFYAGQKQVPDNEKLAYDPMTFFGLNDLVLFVEQDEEVGLQSEVAEAIAAESQLPVKKIKPALARKQNLPRVLPFVEAPGKTPVQSLLSGLERLKQINDRLTVYNDALDRISRNPVADLHLA